MKAKQQQTEMMGRLICLLLVRSSCCVYAYQSTLVSSLGMLLKWWRLNPGLTCARQLLCHRDTTPCILLFTLFWDSFTESPRVTLNLQSFCFSLLSTWISAPYHCLWYIIFKKIKEISMPLAIWAQWQNPWPLSLRILGTESVTGVCTDGFTG